MKRTLAIAVVMAGVGITAVYMFTDRITAEDMTRTRMEITKQRILDYAVANHRLPKTLSELPPFARSENRDDSTDDGWHKAIIYRPQTDGTVVLESRGKDGNGSRTTLQFTVDATRSTGTAGQAK